MSRQIPAQNTSKTSSSFPILFKQFLHHFIYQNIIKFGTSKLSFILIMRAFFFFILFIF